MSFPSILELDQAVVYLVALPCVNIWSTRDMTGDGPNELALIKAIIRTVGKGISLPWVGNTLLEVDASRIVS